MPQSNVVSGSDATISLFVDAGVEGDAAKRIIDEYSLTPVGRAMNVEIQVSSDLQTSTNRASNIPPKSGRGTSPSAGRSAGPTSTEPC
jgi:hypothetical protein